MLLAISKVLRQSQAHATSSTFETNEDGSDDEDDGSLLDYSRQHLVVLAKSAQSWSSEHAEALDQIAVSSSDS